MRKSIAIMAISLLNLSVSAQTKKEVKKDSTYKPGTNPNYEYFVKIPIPQVNLLVQFLDSYKELIPFDYRLNPQQKEAFQKDFNPYLFQFKNGLRVDSLKKK